MYHTTPFNTVKNQSFKNIIPTHNTSLFSIPTVTSFMFKNVTLRSPYMFENITPTPLICYTNTPYKGCDCIVMVKKQGVFV